MNKAEKQVAFGTLFPLMEEVLARGDTVVFAPSGISMQPLLRAGKDRVVLCAVDRPLRRGDVVLYQRESGQFVLHRILKRCENGFCLRGDNQTVTETEVQPSQIKARMCAFYRKDALHQAGGMLDRLMFAVSLPCCIVRILWRRIIRK